MTMTMTRTESQAKSRPLIARRLLLSVALGLAGVDLAAKAAAQRLLSAGRVVDLGPLDLRLVYNPGTAFSLGATLPAPLIVTVVAVIVAAVAVFAWREAAHAALLMVLGLALVLAGAIANLIDRLDDGVVTDYLHSGWWPTFNLADVFITVGAVVVLTSLFRSTPRTVDHRPQSRFE